MKKSILVGLLFLTPYIAYASWWNPGTWFPTTTVVSNVPVTVPVVCDPKIVTKTITDPNDKATIKSLEADIASLKEQVAERNPATKSLGSIVIPSPQSTSQPAQSVNLPIVQSAIGGVIMGKGFSNVTSVYLLPKGQPLTNPRTNLQFGVISDSKIDLNTGSFVLSSGWYDLYVSDSAGNTSASFPVLQNPQCQDSRQDMSMLQNKITQLINQGNQDQKTQTDIANLSALEQIDLQQESSSCTQNLI